MKYAHFVNDNITDELIEMMRLRPNKVFASLLFSLGRLYAIIFSATTDDDGCDDTDYAAIFFTMLLGFSVRFRLYFCDSP